MSGRVYVLRVKPEHRDGRGMYWRPGGHGYTDVIGEAGAWAEGTVPGSDRAEPVEVNRAIVERFQDAPE